MVRSTLFRARRADGSDPAIVEEHVTCRQQQCAFTVEDSGVAHQGSAIQLVAEAPVHVDDKIVFGRILRSVEYVDVLLPAFFDEPQKAGNEECKQTWRCVRGGPYGDRAEPNPRQRNELQFAPLCAASDFCLEKL